MTKSLQGPLQHPLFESSNKNQDAGEVNVTQPPSSELLVLYPLFPPPQGKQQAFDMIMWNYLEISAKTPCYAPCTIPHPVFLHPDGWET